MEYSLHLISFFNVSEWRFIWWKFIKCFLFGQCVCYSLGRELAWVFHVWLLNKYVEFLNAKLNLLIVLDVLDSCESLTSSVTSVLHPQIYNFKIWKVVFFLGCVFSTFLPVSFSNSVSISIRRLSSFFFRFFFFLLSTFLSIKVDWNLLPGRYLSNLKYLSIDDQIPVSLSDSLLCCCLHFFSVFLSFVFFWFSFNGLF